MRVASPEKVADSRELPVKGQNVANFGLQKVS